jgi:hypothetical protein
LIADKKSLYPSLPINETKARVKAKLEALVTGPEKRHQELILELLNVHLDNNYFTFNEKSYKQVKGIPMGRAWAPAVASIYLEKWESTIFDQTKLSPLIYVRYIDDLFAIFRTKSDAQLFVNVAQTLDDNIRLSEVSIDASVHYLDLNISIRHAQLHYAIYTKPSHLRVLLDFQSAHSFTLKCNVVLSQLIRMYRLHSDLTQAGEAMYIFMQLMINFRHLKRRVARLIWCKFMTWLSRQCTRLPAVERPWGLNYLALYLPNNCERDPIKRIFSAFLGSLEENDQLYLPKLRVTERAGRSLGLSFCVV